MMPLHYMRSAHLFVACLCCSNMEKARKTYMFYASGLAAELFFLWFHGAGPDWGQGAAWGHWCVRVPCPQHPIPRYPQ